MLIHSKGSPSAPIWVLIDKPLSGDKDKGYNYSAPLGYVFDKMMAEVGIKEYHVRAYRPDIEHLDAWANIEGEILPYKPPIIIPLGAIGSKLLPQLSPNRRKKNYNEEKDSELSKYAGSILSSDLLSFPHYIIPTYPPDDVVRQWKMRDIIISCDLAKAASELEYWRNHGNILQPLPTRNAKISFSCFDELLCDIDSLLGASIISNDIETIYPKAPTKTQASQFYKKLPGYPIIIALAARSDFGISLELFRDSTVETRELWKHLAKLFWEVPSLGQNFFNFDANYYEMLGFRFDLSRCRDTMIQHHLLWPELKHTLAFQTRQYTREPYYKDDAHGWTSKNIDKWKIYNASDTMVTMEIYLAQLEEMISRGLE